MSQREFTGGIQQAAMVTGFDPKFLHHKPEFFRGFWEKPVGFFFRVSRKKTFAAYLEVACPLIESVGTSKKNQDSCFFLRAC